MADDDREVLDLGVVDPGPASAAPGGGGAGRRPSRRALLAGGLAVAGGLAFLTRTGGAGTPPDRPAPTPSTPAPVVPPPVDAGPAPVVVDLGRPLVTGLAGSVFALCGSDVVRVSPGTGRLTRTRLPHLTGEAVSLVPVRGAVLVHGGNYGPDYVVPDDGAPRPAPAGLSGAGPLLPGPDPDHVWLLRSPGAGAYLVLLDLAGRTTGTTVVLPLRAAGPPVADRAGAALVDGIGGTYRAGAQGLRRVTTGTAVASGPAGCLTVECGDSGGCTGVLVDRRGARRTVDGLLEPTLPVGDLRTVVGALSPDGRSAALYVEDRGRVRLVVLDLGTGRRTPSGLVLDGGAVPEPPFWTPDGRRLLAAPAGRIVVVDAAGGRTLPLLPDDVGAAMPPVRRLAARWDDTTV